MTNDQARCYRERYADMGNKKLKQVKKHWYKTGREEGRNKYCAPRITHIESYCMLARYEHLSEKYGDVMEKVTSDVGDYRMLKYWQQQGFAEGLDASCDDFGGSLSKCAEEGEDCSCPNGDIYYAMKSNGKTVMQTPHDALNWKHTIFNTRLAAEHGGDQWKAVKCEAASFAYDPFKDEKEVETQCLCQSIPNKFPPPLPCAEEGGSCECPGRVLYGASQGKATSPYVAFQGFNERPYTYKEFAPNGKIDCTNAAFGSDPLPGVKKECFCDH